MDRALAYRVLAHAEIEFFIEETIKTTLEEKISQWRNSNRPSHILHCFLACFHSSWVTPSDNALDITGFPSSKLASSAKKSATDVIRIAWDYYKGVIENNHGIRRRNLELLLPPIGLDLDTLDANWVGAIDTFGIQRGVAAHTSALTAQGVRRIFDPKSDYDTVNLILAGLEEFDRRVKALKSL